MASRPRAVIAGVYNTTQARQLDGATSRSLSVEAILGALADAALGLDDVDGISAGELSTELIYDLRLGPAWHGSGFGLGMIVEAVAAIEYGLADVVVVVAAQAGAYRNHSSTAPWTKPENEFIIPWGMFTAAEFALVARRHMAVYGTTRHQLSIVASTIRNNGSLNPGAVYFGRGPFQPADVEASPMIADPFHLLDCAMTSEGGCALVIANADRIDASIAPVHLLGAGADFFGPSYKVPPAWDLVGRRGDDVNGMVGRRAADRAFRHAGIERDDVDVLELYDPFSFEVIRQLEAFGFCGDGEGGPFVEDGRIALTGSHPVTTDGGLLSYSHAGVNPQMLQRAIRAVEQIRRRAGDLQVRDARVALCSNGGSGALFTTVLLLGDEPS
jgi:acetyl-CoA acetyltransferase